MSWIVTGIGVGLGAAYTASKGGDSGDYLKNMAIGGTLGAGGAAAAGAAGVGGAGTAATVGEAGAVGTGSLGTVGTGSIGALEGVGTTGAAPALSGNLASTGLFPATEATGGITSTTAASQAVPASASSSGSGITSTGAAYNPYATTQFTPAPGSVASQQGVVSGAVNGGGEQAAAGGEGVLMPTGKEAGETTWMQDLSNMKTSDKMLAASMVPMAVQTAGGMFAKDEKKRHYKKPSGTFDPTKGTYPSTFYAAEGGLATLENPQQDREMQIIRAIRRYYPSKQAAMQDASVPGSPIQQMGVSGPDDPILTYAFGTDGGQYINAPVGDGMSDSIEASVEGVRPAKLTRGEYVVPADVVSHAGNGSSDAGAEVFDGVVNRIRKARTGTGKQAPAINPDEMMP